ncbi:hypothetical protein E9840_07035 [Tissierella creatinini]|nr:hypothetical protein E9840_07035 [Tissierella creatinini]TJX62490.1 hypothetical protein E8P77_16990 [Soehngenia saccharolytica]
MKLRKFLLIYVILFLILVGCKQNNNQPSIKPKDKAPESLNSLAKGIDDILKKVGDIEKLSLDIPLDEGESKKQPEQGASPEANNQGQEGQGQGSGQDGEEESKNGGGSQKESGNQQGEATQEAKDKNKALSPDNKKEEIDKKWNEAEIKIEEIHPHWNSFEAEGQKKGLTKETADAFESSFNKMTKSLENRNIPEIYDYASQALLRLKPIYDLYTEDMGGDVSAIKYAAYQAYYRTGKGDLEGASKVLTEREANINQIRLKLKEDKKDRVDKVNLSLLDFKDSLVENSRRLFMIKKDIIINNLKELEK